MKTYDAKDIRNVLLVGHGGAGKTTLLEAMLFTSGAITRMGTVEDGTTVSDHDPDEQRKRDLRSRSRWRRWSGRAPRSTSSTPPATRTSSATSAARSGRPTP